MSYQPKMTRARLLATAATGAALLLGAAAPAFAQDDEAAAAEEEREVITVTGYRKSIQDSIAAKREAGAIVEAVSAEDIGKLPDVSIAESLARLPGITSQRVAGRSQVIQVRGLAPDFTTALLNGREIVSAGTNRGVEFDQFPSELLNQVLVYKTPEASLLGQGLAGTADLRTVRPLSYDDRVLQFGARYEFNQIDAVNPLGEDQGYRFSGSFIDQTDDGRWGIALGAALSSTPVQIEAQRAWGYTGGGTPGNPFVFGGGDTSAQTNVLERLGLLGVVQFEPSANFTSTLDLFYSDFQEDQYIAKLEGGVAFTGATVLAEDQDGNATLGVANNQKFVVRNDFRNREAETIAIGWNNAWDISEMWSLDADVSYSNVDRIDTDLETYSGVSRGGGNGPFDTLGFARLPSTGRVVFNSTLDYSDASNFLLTDPGGWGQVGFIKRPSTEDSLAAVRLAATRELTKENWGPLGAFEFGVNVNQREKTAGSDEAFLRGFTNGAVDATIPAEFLAGNAGLDFAGFAGGLYTYDALALYNSGFYTEEANTNADVRIKSWKVQEDVATLYGKFLVDSQIANLPLTGNFGAQYVFTDQSSSGARASGSSDSDVVDFTDGNEYSEFLPSLNLALEIADQQFIRLGVARTLARGRMEDMRASFQVGYNNTGATNFPGQPDPLLITNDQILQGISQGIRVNTYYGGGGGNPQLEPWIAQAVDVSWEKYFGEGGYIAIAGFYKYLENYIYNEFSLVDFTGVAPNPGNPTEVPASTLGYVSIPQNAQGGEMKGIEMSVVVPLDIISPWLDGFGVNVNAAFNESQIQVPGNPASALPGFSEKTVNSTIYYEKYGFNARVSNRYRDDFLGEIIGFGAGRELHFVKGESIFDAQVGYQFEQGPLEGLSLLLQANNLTDEPFGTYYNGDPRQVRDSQRYGTTYLIGLNYRR